MLYVGDDADVASQGSEMSGIAVCSLSIFFLILWTLLGPHMLGYL